MPDRPAPHIDNPDSTLNSRSQTWERDMPDLGSWQNHSDPKPPGPDSPVNWLSSMCQQPQALGQQDTIQPSKALLHEDLIRDSHDHSPSFGSSTGLEETFGQRSSERDLEVLLKKLAKQMTDSLRRTEELGERALKRQVEVESKLIRRLDDLQLRSAVPSPEELARLASDASRQALRDAVSDLESKVRDLESRLHEPVIKMEELLEQQHEMQRCFISRDRAAQEEAQQVQSFTKQAAEAVASHAVQELGMRLTPRLNDSLSSGLDQIASRIASDIEQATERWEKSAHALRIAVQTDLSTIGQRNEMLGDSLRECSRAQMEVQDDMRKLNISLHQNATIHAGHSGSGLSYADDLRQVMDEGFRELLQQHQELLQGNPERDYEIPTVPAVQQPRSPTVGDVPFPGLQGIKEPKEAPPQRQRPKSGGMRERQEADSRSGNKASAREARLHAPSQQSALLSAAAAAAAANELEVLHKEYMLKAARRPSTAERDCSSRMDAPLRNGSKNASSVFDTPGGCEGREELLRQDSHTRRRLSERSNDGRANHWRSSGRGSANHVYYENS